MRWLILTSIIHPLHCTARWEAKIKVSQTANSDILAYILGLVCFNVYFTCYAYVTLVCEHVAVFFFIYQNVIPE